MPDKEKDDLNDHWHADDEPAFPIMKIIICALIVWAVIGWFIILRYL